MSDGKKGLRLGQRAKQWITASKFRKRLIFSLIALIISSPVWLLLSLGFSELALRARVNFQYRASIRSHNAGDKFPSGHIRMPMYRAVDTEREYELRSVNGTIPLFGECRWEPVEEDGILVGWYGVSNGVLVAVNNHVGGEFCPRTTLDEQLWNCFVRYPEHVVDDEWKWSYSVDSSGYRGGFNAPDFTAKERIVVVGDSITFGWGVETTALPPTAKGGMFFGLSV